MNAADQRRLTPVLGVACAVVAAVFVALALGVGRGVHWQAPGRAQALPAASSTASVAAPPLSQFADVWRHPLFTSDRQPADEADGGDANVRLGDLELTGIILTPDLHMALLHGPPDKDVEVREGDNVGNSGWRLVKLGARSAVFERNGERTELKLETADHDAARQATPAQPVAQPARMGSQPPPGMLSPRAVMQRMQQQRKRNQSRRRQVQPAPKQEH